MTGIPKKYREDLTPHQWKKRVIEVLERDGYRCQYTRKQYTPDNHALHVHHRIPKRMGGKGGGDDQIDNLASCDWEKHQDHGSLRMAKLITEKDDTKIDELRKRYR